MRHKNHGNCSHALEEDAPKVLGHGFVLKWAVAATERRTPWSGGYQKKWREKMYIGNQYIVRRNSTGGGIANYFNLYQLKMKRMASLRLAPPASTHGAAPRHLLSVVILFVFVAATVILLPLFLPYSV